MDTATAPAKRGPVFEPQRRLYADAILPVARDGQFPEVGTGISVTVPDGPPVLPPQTAIRPDGGTLFIVGRKGVLVVPAPP